MFVQVIEGHTADPEAIHRQIDAWDRDVRPGAIGYLGSTGGCTADGHCILVARFEDREAARRNSDRPEQTAWWRETEACFDGEVTFHDSEEVEVMAHGDLGRARFVQVMEGHVRDRRRVAELEREADDTMRAARPDLLGSVTAYFGTDEFCSVGYFTSEDEARRNEKRPVPGDAAEKFQEWRSLMTVDRYLDLSEPWMVEA